VLQRPLSQEFSSERLTNTTNREITEPVLKEKGVASLF